MGITNKSLLNAPNAAGPVSNDLNVDLMRQILVGNNLNDTVVIIHHLSESGLKLQSLPDLLEAIHVVNLDTVKVCQETVRSFEGLGDDSLQPLIEGEILVIKSVEEQEQDLQEQEDMNDMDMDGEES